MPEVRELEFTLNGFRYAAQAWGDPQARPVLALHGWLDNSASFAALAGYLKDVYLVAPDLAGHGKTDHFTGFNDYCLWSENVEMLAIVDQLGWHGFTLVGHSRGGMMAAMLAAAAPERIKQLVFLDAICPSPTTENKTAWRFQQKLRDSGRKLLQARQFGSLDEAITARSQNEFGQISALNSARLAERGVSEKEGRWFWHADQQLKVKNSLALTEAQIDDIFAAIKAPMLALMAKNGWPKMIERDPPLKHLVTRLVEEHKIDYQEFDDGHFFHMEQSTAAVAQAILRFMQDNA